MFTYAIVGACLYAAWKLYEFCRDLSDRDDLACRPTDIPEKKWPPDPPA
jgi:hypothetical protein